MEKNNDSGIISNLKLIKNETENVVSRKIPWSSEVMDVIKSNPRAPHPSKLLSEYMSKGLVEKTSINRSGIVSNNKTRNVK